MSFLKPVVPLIPEPVGLDVVIQRLQIALAAGLPWLDYSFGRATTGQRKGADTNDAVQLRPEVYMGENRYEPVEPNSHWAGHSFIQVAGPERPVDFQKMQANTYSTQLELIVLVNLENIRKKTTLNYGHRFTEEIKQEIKKVLRKLTQYTIVAVHETPGEVFRGYTYDEYSHQTFRHPQAGYKFILDVAYNETC
jgi:hypothetical protein